MNLYTIYHWLKRANYFGKKQKPQAIQTPVYAIVPEFTWSLTIENNTIRNQCAIDALMTVVSIDRDFITYSATKEQMHEYTLFCAANKRAIAAEELKNYKY